MLAKEVAQMNNEQTREPGWCAPNEMLGLYAQAEIARKALSDKLWSTTPGILLPEEIEAWGGDDAR
jgi:hypothetical protein